MTLYGGSLQGKILLIVFHKIQSLCPGRDPFAGIICEFSACIFFKPNAMLHAQDLAFIDFGSVNAVAACPGMLFSKQHG